MRFCLKVNRWKKFNLFLNVVSFVDFIGGDRSAFPVLISLVS